MLLTPNPSLLNIRPYVGGKSSVDGGQPIIKLSSNENPYGPSPSAIEALKAASTSLHRYPESSYIALREAIAEIHGLDANHIVCGAGSDEIIGMLVHAYANEGDEVLYSEHGFLMYKIYALANGCVPVTAPEKKLTTDVDALLAAVTEKTKIVFVANPNNPTGSYISGAELKRLRDELRDDILLVVDAAYSEYVQANDYSDGMALADLPNVAVTRTFSKLYGLGGLRVGWCYAHADIIDILNRIRSPFNVAASSAFAAEAAVRNVDYVNEMRAKNNGWLKKLSAFYEEIGLTAHPSVGNFILVEFPDVTGKTASDVNIALMARGIIPREVANYGLPHCLRISIGKDSENEALMEALREIVA